MTSNFIIFRFDRLKYSDLSSLYLQINKILLRDDVEKKNLTVPFARYSEQMALLTNLETKTRSKYFKKESAVYLKRLDDLVSALLLHLKALGRADFPEYSYDVKEVNKVIRKELINFVHVGIDNKKSALNVISNYFNPVDNWLWECAVRIGVSRYLEELRITREKMDSLEKAEKGAKNGQSSSVEAVKAKAELIKEMRTLLQCIDMTVLNYPDVDYTSLIVLINYELKEHRTQLRNLQTRRIRKKEKENEVQSTDQEEINP